MAATALVRELLGRVSTLIGDTAPQFQRFPEIELVRWLVDGQVAIAKYLPSATARTDAIKLVAGTRQSIDAVNTGNIVPGDGVTLSAPLFGIQLLDVIRNMGADGLTPGSAVQQCERDLLDQFSRSWHNQPGDEVENYTYDERLPTTFYVVPGVKPTPALYVEVQWSIMPRTIPPGNAIGSERYGSGGADNTAITIADKFLDDLYCYMLARAQLKDSKFADASKTQLYSQWFVNSINAQVKALTGASPNLVHLPGAA